MRYTVFLTAMMMASITAITALPIQQEQQEARHEHKTEHARSHKLMTSSKITYYSGKQLNNPACGGHNPTSHSMIAAVKEGGAFSCGDNVHIQHGSKEVVVKVVDFCESCGHEDMDLTTGAFSKLAPLSQGEISGAKVYHM